MSIQLYLIAIVLLAIALLATIGVALTFFGIFDNISVHIGPPAAEVVEQLNGDNNSNNVELAYKVGNGIAADAGAVFTEVNSIVPRHTTIGVYLELDKKLRSSVLAKEMKEEEEKESDDRAKRDKKDGEQDQDEPRLDTFSDGFNATSSECRYLVGVLVSDKVANDVDNDNGDKQVNNDNNNSSSVITETDRKLLIDRGFRFVKLPKLPDNVVSITFPYRGFLSVPLLWYRVYPTLLSYIREHRLIAYPAIELYVRNTIHLLFPLDHHERFVELLLSSRDSQLKSNLPVTTSLEKETSASNDEFSDDSSDDSRSSFEKL